MSKGRGTRDKGQRKREKGKGKRDKGTTDKGKGGKGREYKLFLFSLKWSVSRVRVAAGKPSSEAWKCSPYLARAGVSSSG